MLHGVQGRRSPCSPQLAAPQLASLWGGPQLALSPLPLCVLLPGSGESMQAGGKSVQEGSGGMLQTDVGERGR